MVSNGKMRCLPSVRLMLARFQAMVSDLYILSAMVLTTTNDK